MSLKSRKVFAIFKRKIQEDGQLTCAMRVYKDKKECESWIKEDIEGWKRYQTYVPDFRLPKYEIVELELRVVKCVPQ